MRAVRISAVWCPSCLVMKPRFEAIEQKYPNIEFKSFDIDFDEEASNYQIGNILPVLILLNNEDTELTRLIGEHKLEDIINTIESHL